MKKLIIITILLLIATAVVTVAYFKHLNPPGQRATQVINTIPPSAALIFEFNNDDSFYDIYQKSSLFSAVTGKNKMAQLHALRQSVLGNNLLKPFFSDQNIFVSIHPQRDDSLAFLITISTTTELGNNVIAQAVHQPNVKLKAVKFGKKAGYALKTDSLDSDFYLANKGSGIWLGSFSKDLVEESLKYAANEQTSQFVLLPDQQNATSLGTLYVNYKQVGPLLNQLYKGENVDLWKGLPMLPATATLSLNYKSDALMFNGFTTFKSAQHISYVDIFRKMAPVAMDLKNLFPSTTAYGCSYATPDVKLFKKLLNSWQHKAGLEADKSSLFKKIKNETGVQFNKEFDNLLDNEFAVITTRFQEKLAIIKVKNGTALRPYLNNISTLTPDEESGQLNYNQVFLFLLGDALTPFRRPYFIILDNYLVLANSSHDLANFKQNYLNNEFLNNSADYVAFNNLLAQRCNVSYFVHFKNAGYVFKRTLKSPYAKAYQQQPGLKDYYAASYQLSASENQYYTNLCFKLNTPDSVSLSR
ncbi:hypothetical protein ABDD95_08340 [Mucilaginibacter sp. PAMB04274]|uniref:hypothetical protein n=1 Tax=Mucilaginibacter sp. PAMB04274 TaxID=3138568 RepID=UPI0031F71B5F